MKVYLDSAPIIYTIEQVPILADAVDRIVNSLRAILVTSEIARLEVAVQPLREKKQEILLEYETFFDESVTEMVALSRGVIERAAGIRADYGFQTPDAIHLAAAIEAKCDAFLTNDRRLRSFSGIKVILVESEIE